MARWVKALVTKFPNLSICGTRIVEGENQLWQAPLRAPHLDCGTCTHTMKNSSATEERELEAAVQHDKSQKQEDKQKEPPFHIKKQSLCCVKLFIGKSQTGKTLPPSFSASLSHSLNK